MRRGPRVTLYRTVSQRCGDALVAVVQAAEGDDYVDHLSPLVREYHEHGQRPEPNRRHDEESPRGQRFFWQAQGFRNSAILFGFESLGVHVCLMFAGHRIIGLRVAAAVPAHLLVRGLIP